MGPLGRKNADSARPPKPCASNKMGSKTAPPIHHPPAPQATVDDPARLRQLYYTPRLPRESLDIAAIVQRHGIGRPDGFPAPHGQNERRRRHESKAQGATRCCCALLSMRVTARRPLRTRGGQWHARHVSSASQNPMTTWSLEMSQVRQMCGAKQRIISGTYAPVRRNFPTTLHYIGHI